MPSIKIIQYFINFVKSNIFTIYYDNILNQIKKEQEEGFIGDDLSKLIIIINSLDELKEYLERRN